MLGDTPSVANLGQRRQEESIPAAITDIGCEREINEDRYAVVDSPAGRAWIVCDGMGGSLGGELAAQLAIDAIRRALESQDFDTGEEALRFAIEEANRIIVLRRQNPAFSSMGTTIVGALIQGDEVVITHAGDSRAYLVRAGEIQQLTVDHTYVQDLVDRGSINAEEALSHPQSHVLTRCLGAEPRLELDAQTFWIWDASDGEAEDRLLLCSDGLYSLVSDSEIAERVTNLTPQEACVQLVELAKQRGGYDNITLAVLPLGGQLHEESAGPSSRPVRRKKHETVRSAVYERRGPRLSLGKRIALMGILLVLGCLVAALFVLFSLNG
ncbi:MAG: Stp1/IreP family PP2C-type Ser/Thr phosphatase [Bdellovibrionales bacterium]|nr:Stp1/IreP family PP2C-type Ser/Thr phosphatase [Bdellovibrionales bacterium]